MFTALALALAFGGAARAESCDARQLARDIDDASPVAVPRVFLELVECDPELAAKTAPLAMSKILHVDEGNQAALAALEVGAQGPVMEWVDGLEPDHRSQTMLWLGDQCAEVPEVGRFFVDSAEQKTEPFLKERWYRGMAKCRVPEVQTLLQEIVEEDKLGLDRERTFGFLEVYARNLGKEAIPHLRSTAGSLSDPKEINLLINAFGDAANVGSVEGIDEEAAKEAIAALEALAPQTHPEAIPQMRNTLLALGAPELADQIVRYRWPDRLEGDTYAYGVTATEEITCKNGKAMWVFHHGRLTDVSRWPDALEMDVEDAVKRHWKVDHASKCKGSGKLSVQISPEPVAGDEGYTAWVQPLLDAFEQAAKGAWKSEIIEEPTTAF